MNINETMKITNYFMLAALALSAAACSSDEVNGLDNSPVEAKITAGLAGAQGRASNTYWASSDDIGVMVTNSTKPGSTMPELYKNVRYTNSSGSSVQEAIFTTTTGNGIFFEDAEETVTFAAYYPYQSSDPNALPGAEGVISVNTKTSSSNQVDFLYASGVTASKSSPTVAFSGENAFQHKMAKLVLVVKVSTADGFQSGDISSVNYVTLGGLKHKGTFNVTDGTTAVTTEIAENCSLYLASEKGESKTCSQILLPQEVTTPLPLSFTIRGQKYTASLSISGNKLESGKIYTCTVTAKAKANEMTTIQTSTISDWTEGGSTSSEATMM